MIQDYFKASCTELANISDTLRAEFSEMDPVAFTCTAVNHAKSALSDKGSVWDVGMGRECLVSKLKWTSPGLPSCSIDHPITFRIVVLMPPQNFNRR